LENYPEIQNQINQILIDNNRPFQALPAEKPPIKQSSIIIKVPREQI
jgi:hypothetical protein